MVSIIEQKDIITKSVWNYLQVEMVEGGLLNDVNSYIKHFLSEEQKNPPVIWVWEHPTIPQPGKTANLSNKQQVQTTFEFICCAYDTDLSNAQIYSDNLASRVGASILKNFNTVKIPEDTSKRLFTNVEFKAIYPVGEGITISGKNKSVPATRILFDFNWIFDWLKCRRVTENIEENTGGI